MTRSKILDIVTLTRNGWAPYHLEPDKAVYERIGCPLVLKEKKEKPFWFVREDTFCCVGCQSNCTLKNPAGFRLPLPFAHEQPEKPKKYYLSPKEMLARHDLLNAKQAAYCLNVSERTIYNYIAEGKLVRLKENPVRVRSSEVRALRENFDE